MSTEPSLARRDARALLARAGADARRLIDALGSERALPLLGYAVFTVGLFVVFLLATFPYDAAVQRALSEGTGALAVDARGGRAALPLAYALDELRLTPRNGDPATVWLAASDVRLAPSLLGLVRGRPWPLGFAARLYDGRLEGLVDPRPETFVVDVTFQDLDLGRYAGLRPWVQGALAGRLAGAVDLRGDAATPGSIDGTVDLRAAGLALEDGRVSGFGIPPLHFGAVHVAATVTKGRVEIGELVADGQEITVRGNGTIVLRTPVGASLVNLELTLTPAAGAPDALRPLLGLIPGTNAPDGARVVRVSGSLAQLRVRQ